MSEKKSKALKVTNKGKRAITKTVVVETPPADDVEVKGKPIPLPRAPGAQKIVDTKSPEAVKKEIDELLDQLRACEDKNRKKAIRRSLRTRGHYGGLGLAKGRKATKAVVEDDDEDDDD